MHTFQPLLDQIAQNRFFYSIEIVSDIAVIAAFNHYDTTLGIGQPSGGGLTNGTQRGSTVVLEDFIGPERPALVLHAPKDPRSSRVFFYSTRLRAHAASHRTGAPSGRGIASTSLNTARDRITAGFRSYPRT